MQDKYIFREMLGELRELADLKDNKLNREDVEKHLANARLSDQQLEMVFDYLETQKIKVIGYDAKTLEPEISEPEAPFEEAKIPEENELTAMYYEELGELEALTETEEFRLFMEAANGEKSAVTRLIEHHLKTVYDLSKTFVGSNLTQADLIQEGNIGLIMAFDDIKSMGSLEEYQNYIFRSITEAMEEAVTISEDTRDMDEEITGRVNHLNEAILNLEKDLGHKVSVEELSAYLEMPKDEIEDILRMAGDQMKG